VALVAQLPKGVKDSPGIGGRFETESVVGFSRNPLQVRAVFRRMLMAEGYIPSPAPLLRLSG